MHALEPGWAVLISMVVGALIGGLTNLLAIVMLFRPHRAWKIGKWTVPLTPGLIPKRHAELARQLGRVVEKHLLSPESVSGFIQNSLAPGWLRRLVMDGLERLRHWEKTPLECLQAIGWSASFSPADASGKGPAWFAHGWSVLRQRVLAIPGRTLADWLGEDGVAIVRAQMPALARRLWVAANDLLDREEGRQSVLRFTRDLLQTNLPGSRMWVALAFRFVDEERLAAWLAQRMQEWLARPRTKELLSRWLERQWEAVAHRPLADWLKPWEEEGNDVAKIVGMVAERGAGELLNTPLNQLLAPFEEEAFRQSLAAALDSMEQKLAHRLPALFSRLPVGPMVERQVLAYPLPQLEKLIVEIAYRELKMITLLGAVIGGLVGLIQGGWLVFMLG